jgi:integrase
MPRVAKAKVDDRRQRRRRKGKGSIYKQPGRDLWVASLVVRSEGLSKRLYAYAPTETEAEDKLEELKTKGTVPATSLTIKDLMAQWLADLERQGAPNYRASTIERYRSTVKLHVIPDLGPTRVVRLTAADVRAFDARMKAKGKSAPTRAAALLALSTALDFAVSEETVVKNVAKIVKTPQHTPKAVPAIPIEHAIKIIHEAQSERLGPMYIVALALGVRQGEAFALKRDDIDFKAGTMKIERSLREDSNSPTGFVESLPKTGQTRTIPLVEPALGALRQHLEKAPGTEYVFTAEKGGPLRKSVFMRKTWAPFLKRIGLPRYTFHQCRHTTASLLAALNIHPTTASAILGHSAEVHLNTYAKPDLAEQKKAAERLGDLLSGVSKPVISTT